MKIRLIGSSVLVSILALGCVLLPSSAEAQIPKGTPLTYQGEIWINGAPLAEGDYDLAVQFLSNDQSTLCGSSATSSVHVLAGKFSQEISDPTCRTKITTATEQIWVKVSGRGGALGTSETELGLQAVSAGVFALTSNGGGLGVGDVIISILDLNVFQSLHGTDWVLADGGAAPVGSAYATLVGGNLPDLRGVYLRGHKGRTGDPQGVRPDTANPGADIYAENIPLTGYMNDTLRAHSHPVAPYSGQVGAGNVQPAQQQSGSSQTVGNGTSGPFGGKETRPKTSIVNYYIRVN